MSDDQEVWREVPGYPRYKVSNHGRVLLAGGRITRGNTCGKYLYVGVSRGSTETGDYKKTNKGVHVFVGLAFIPLVPGKTHINHIDCNPHNNRVENLEWCTPAENNSHPPTLAKRNKKPAAKGYRKQRNGRYQVQIWNKGTHKCLGTYDTTQEARLVYLRAWFEKQKPLNATQQKNLLKALQELRESCVNASH